MAEIVYRWKIAYESALDGKRRHQLTKQSTSSDLLREGLVRTVAMVQMLAEKWYEPIRTTKIHGSTLVQQVLSALSQNGGAHAQRLWEMLFGAGPFAAVSKAQFLALITTLGQEEILFQDPTGLVLLAPKGERITEHYSFYAEFATDEEYRIVSGSRTLGSMPISRPFAPVHS